MNSNSLTPNTIAGVLDRAFRIYRDNFVTFIGLVAIVIIPMTILSTIASSSMNRSLQQDFGTFDPNSTRINFDLPEGFWLVILISVVAAFLQGVVINGVITYMASENHLGYQINIADAFNNSRDRLWTLALALIIFGVIFAIGFFITVLIGAVCLIPLLALPILFYLGLSIYFFIVPTTILENVSVSTAISRALALGKARFWQTFSVFVLIQLITVILGFVLGVLIAVVTGSSTDEIVSTGGPNTMFIILSTAINIFVLPMLPIALTIMYYDVRVRTEGLDIALQSVDKADPRPSDVESPQPQGRLLTRQDFSNIVLLVIGFIGLVLLLGILGNLFAYALFGF